jgi:O-methyltransferase involved in polyketide biosynthesis
VHLADIPETLLFPLYMRAVETRRRTAMLADPRAVGIVNAIDYDFDRFGTGGARLRSTILRGATLDCWVRAFLERHPDGTVIDLGTGLNTRFERLDNGRVHWIDLDLPDAIALRRAFFADTDRRTMIEGSILDESWVTTALAHPGPYFLVAEAVLMYFPANEIRTVLQRVVNRFPGAHIAFDTRGSHIVRRQREYGAFKNITAELKWACDDQREMVRAVPGLELLESRIVTRPPRPVRRLVPTLLRQLLPISCLLPSSRAYRLHLFKTTGASATSSM